MKKMIFLVLWLVASQTFAGSIVKVSPIGFSPKGQFVAFEEFGFSDKKIPYSKIRVFNTWKNKYVSKEFKLIGKEDVDSLELVRLKVKKLALKDLKKYDIST
jgi:predicted secreted protein